MKIKLAILECDESYLARIATTFNSKYGENLEIYSFTNMEIALATLESARIDLLVANDSFEIDRSLLPRRCGLGYFVESADIETVNGSVAIFKYQKLDLIYKQLLSLYAETAGNISGVRTDDGSCKVIVFSSPSGGVGNSCMAAACATSYAARGRKTLYLNLERFGGANTFFTSEGAFDMSDVVFAVKSKKANLALKLESYVRRDSRGVFFYAQSKLALDTMELGSDEIIGLLSELQTIGSYDYLIVDRDFALDADSLKIFRKAHALVMVCDGTEISNMKTERAYTAISTMERDADAPITSRMKLIYNRFSNKTGGSMVAAEVKNIGGAPRYAHATTAEVISQLSGMGMFEQIL